MFCLNNLNFNVQRYSILSKYYFLNIHHFKFEEVLRLLDLTKNFWNDYKNESTLNMYFNS